MGGIGSFFGFRPQSGGGGGEGTPSTEALQKGKREDRTGDTSFPSGAMAIYIKHTDVGGGFITVNGEEIYYGGSWEEKAIHNAATNKMELVQSVDVVSTGVEYSFKVAYPSTNPVDINSI